MFVIVNICIEDQSGRRYFSSLSIHEAVDGAMVGRAELRNFHIVWHCPAIFAKHGKSSHFVA